MGIIVSYGLTLFGLSRGKIHSFYLKAIGSKFLTPDAIRIVTYIRHFGFLEMNAEFLEFFEDGQVDFFVDRQLYAGRLDVAVQDLQSGHRNRQSYGFGHRRVGLVFTDANHFGVDLLALPIDFVAKFVVHHYHVFVIRL